MRVKAIISVIGVSLLVLGSVIFITGSLNKDIQINKIERGMYVSHSIIRINSNTEFAQIAQQENWSGNGTQNNPYMISGYDIDAHSAGNCIYIGNTTVYFVIKECYLHNASYHSYPYFYGTGIALYNVKNGKIINNSISYNNIGVMLQSSCKYNIIDGNSILHNADNGIYLFGYEEYIIIRNNTVSNNRVGIKINNSLHITITNNTFSDNTASEGIWLYTSNNCKIINNKVSNSKTGIHLDSCCDNNTIINNTVTYNLWLGIDIWKSNNNMIKNNTISDTIGAYYGYGVWIRSSKGNMVICNKIINNPNYGVYVEISSSNYIFNNSFYYNHGSGDTFNFSNIQAYDDSSDNYWNSSFGVGNYWHDWANNNNTNDQNNDGIVDWPYPIDGSAEAKDYYPLKNSPVHVPEISVNWVAMNFGILMIFPIFMRKRFLP